jgi:acyl-coenzyme A thioesterase PaaI-like protein
VNELPQNAFHRRPDLHVETEGEFAGWRTWTRDNFEHLNGQQNVHGGCFMSFADYSLFAIASSVLEGPGVTVAFACEFLDAAREGELIECEGEITRAGGSLIFLRGVLKSGERSLFTFSGTIKRVKRKKPTDTGAVAS